MNCHYVLCVTSCQRFDLLKIALDTFIATGNHPRATFICEDSSDPRPGWLDNSYESNLGKITWLSNGARRGQVYSIDRLIASIPKEIERVAWIEDDWSFTGSGFIFEGLRILDECPDICQVVFRKDWGHPLVDDPRGFKIAQRGWRGVWGGWTFNPHVTRTNDLKRFGTYASQSGYVAGYKHEEVFSKKFLDAGYSIAVIPHHCFHTGNNRSLSHDGWVPSLPKILIAIPVCHSLNYTKWESGDSPLYDKRTAYNGQPYGTGIHISGPNDRIQALRDTWLKDVAKFPNATYKLFYGEGASRQPGSDEVFLSIPDDYAHLPHKTIAICRYAKENDYDFVAKFDDDSFVWVDRLIHEILSSQWDYGGYLNGRVAAGGPGYILSRRAFTIIADDCNSNSHWAEDCTVGKCLFYHNIQPVHLEDHHSGRENHWFDIDKIPPNSVSLHALQSETMRELYKRERSAAELYF